MKKKSYFISKVFSITLLISVLVFALSHSKERLVSLSEMNINALSDTENEIDDCVTAKGFCRIKNENNEIIRVNYLNIE
ncbi:MAG: hypothetical protein PHF92_09510 [Bacteroidales bacterium]|nr:hypothetical protein [Bacteroidales bacterium]